MNDGVSNELLTVTLAGLLHDVGKEEQDDNHTIS